MEIAFYLLLILGVLGIFDIVYYHTYICKLDDHQSSAKEVIIHKLRYPVYGFLFLLSANVRLSGAWCFLGILLVVLDFAISVFDVLEEPYSRRLHGGMPRGEYLLHFLFALLLGAFYLVYLKLMITELSSPSEIGLSKLEVPIVLKLLMSYMGIRAFSLLFLPIKIPHFMLTCFSRIDDGPYVKFK